MALTCLVLSCSKHKDDKPLDITGDWSITSIGTRAATIGSQTVEVYISFQQGGVFMLYQKTGSGRFNKFEGSWTLSGNLLGGKYSDGTSWGATYNVSLNDGLLTLESNTTPVEVSVYEKTAIPQNVISESITSRHPELDNIP